MKKPGNRIVRALRYYFLLYLRSWREMDDQTRETMMEIVEDSAY